MRFFGDQEATTRTLSVAFSVATTGVMMRLGAELRGLAGAAVFGALHAVSVMSVTYAQETRMYAQFEFLMALDLLFFLRVIRT